MNERHPADNEVQADDRCGRKTRGGIGVVWGSRWGGSDARHAAPPIRHSGMTHHQLQRRPPLFALGKQRLVVPHALAARLTGHAHIAPVVPPAPNLCHHLGDALISYWTIVADHLGEVSGVSVASPPSHARCGST